MNLRPFIIAVLTGSALAAGEAIVTLRPSEELKLMPGQAKDAAIEIVVQKGFHVQANPAANEFLIPLTLSVFDETGALKVGAPSYPRASRYRLKGTNEDLLVYDGVIKVTVPIQSSGSTHGGHHTLRGKVRYQACDERSCRPPATAPFELKVRVLPGRVVR